MRGRNMSLYWGVRNDYGWEDPLEAPEHHPWDSYTEPADVVGLQRLDSSEMDKAPGLPTPWEEILGHYVCERCGLESKDSGCDSCGAICRRKKP
jgi:hypothetical protein